jgi:hypothetical protein
MNTLSERLLQGIVINQAWVDEIARQWVTEGYSLEDCTIERVCIDTGSGVAAQLEGMLKVALHAKSVFGLDK